MDIVELIQQRLQALGFTTIPTGTELNFSKNRAESYIKSFCNISEIPQALYYVWCDIACGYFLQDGLLLNNISDIDLSVGVEKSITEGDVSVTYDGSTSQEDKTKNLIENLLNGHNSELIKYRKLVW